MDAIEIIRQIGEARDYLSDHNVTPSIDWSEIIDAEIEGDTQYLQDVLNTLENKIEYIN